MIHVLAIVTAKPGQRAALLDVFHANVPAVQAEAGCLEYGPAIDLPDASGATFGPDTFVVIEKWADADALRAHSVAPHMKAYAEQTRDLIATRAIHVLTPA